MKILHAVEAFAGGQMELVRQLARGAAGEGHEVTIAHGIRPETPDELEPLVGAHVELVPMASWSDRSPLRQLRAPRELRALVRSRDPDLVHLHSSFAGVAGALGVPRGIPTVFSPQAFASTLETLGAARRRAYQAAERLVLRRVTATMASSPSEARYARDVLGAQRVELVENGIAELDHPQPARDGGREPVVIASGRMVSQRQPEACARILGAVNDVGRAVWFGDTEGDRKRSGIEALRSSGVEVTGWMPREKYLARLSAASAYLHWTATDGQPLSILEAMAADVPVVASDIPPSRDLLAPDQVCSSEDEAAALIRRILTDASLADGIRADQRSRREHYGAERMARECLELYERIR